MAFNLAVWIVPGVLALVAVIAYWRSVSSAANRCARGDHGPTITEYTSACEIDRCSLCGVQLAYKPRSKNNMPQDGRAVKNR